MASSPGSFTIPKRQPPKVPPKGGVRKPGAKKKRQRQPRSNKVKKAIRKQFKAVQKGLKKLRRQAATRFRRIKAGLRKLTRRSASTARKAFRKSSKGVGHWFKARARSRKAKLRKKRRRRNRLTGSRRRNGPALQKMNFGNPFRVRAPSFASPPRLRLRTPTLVRKMLRAMKTAG